MLGLLLLPNFYKQQLRIKNNDVTWIFQSWLELHGFHMPEPHQHLTRCRHQSLLPKGKKNRKIGSLNVLDKNRLQNNSYFCIVKYVWTVRKNHKYMQTVEQKVWSESERGKWDSDTMLELHTLKSDFEKKNQLSCSLEWKNQRK